MPTVAGRDCGVLLARACDLYLLVGELGVLGEEGVRQLLPVLN